MRDNATEPAIVPGRGGAARPCPLALVPLVLLVAGNALGAFTEVPQFGSGATIPVAWGDHDLDGDLDLAVGNYFGQQNELYVNQGGGSFIRETPFGSDNTFAVVWADYDNDGDLDLAVGNGAGGQNRLYRNEGGGSFTVQNQFGTNSTVALAWADFDLDGDLDLAVGNGILGAVQQNFIYVNNGDGSFAGVPQFGTGQTGSVVWGDINDDFYPDLAVGNGGFGFQGPNALYVNNRDGTFTVRTEFGDGDTACLVWGDYDGDTDLDLAVANWDGGQNRLYINNGDETFNGQDQFGARDPNTMAWGDSDLDGDLDLAVGNGDFTSADQNYLYVNNADGSFSEQPEFGLGSTDAVAWGDYDGDGDLDLASGNEHSPPQNYLYTNDANQPGWLALHLVGHFHDRGNGFSNRNGIGAKVLVYEPGFLGSPDHLIGFREIEAHGGFASQSSGTDAHFGVPGVQAVDVRIRWPGSNGSRLVQDLIGIAIGQRLIIDEDGAPSGIDDPAATPRPRVGLRVTPNPARSRAGFEVDMKGASAADRLVIYDNGGRLVRALPLVAAGPDRQLRAEWDRRASNGRLVPQGVYFARLISDRSGTVARFVVLR